MEGVKLVILCCSMVYVVSSNSRIGDHNFFTVNPQSSQKVHEGNRVTLHCDVKDKQFIVFSWMKDDVLLPNTTRRYQAGRNLVIERVNRTLDTGSFTCITRNVSSGFRMQSKQASLIIQYISQEANVILRRPKSGDITEGLDITLRCEASANPLPTITWFKNKIRIFEDEITYQRYRLVDNRLKILSVEVKDNGVFTCQADNDIGTAESSGSYLLNIPGENSAKLRDSLFSKRTVAVRGDTVWIHCAFENAVSTNWYMGATTSNLLTNTTKSRITVYGNGTLKIEEVRRSDETTYLCEGRGADDIQQTFTADLIIARLGRMTGNNLEPTLDMSRPVVLAEGESFQVNCLRPSGAPTPSMSWQNDDGVQILSGGSVSVEGTKLVIMSATSSDTGNYSCVAENMAGRKSITFELVVTVLPTIITPPQDTHVSEDEYAVFSCSFTGTQLYSKVTWYKDGSRIPDLLLKSRKLEINEQTGALSVMKAEPSLEGSYTCSVQTEKQNLVTSSPARLVVIKKLKFTPQPRGRTLELGSVESLRCLAEAQQTPVINWVRTPATIPMGDHVTDSNGVLTFNGVQKNDAGNYTCVALLGSTQEVISATVYVSVGTTPVITVKPSNVTAIEGDNVTLNCVATGWPEPKLRWYKNENTDMTNMPRYTVLDNGSLVITSVQMSDASQYLCLVGNNKAFDRADMQLTVEMNTTGLVYLPENNTLFETEAEESIGMLKTIVIAVCSAVAYLALVISLTVWCSIRLMKRKKIAKLNATAEEEGQRQNGGLPKETDRLMAPTESAATVVTFSNSNGQVMTNLSSASPVVLTDTNSISSPSHRSSSSRQSRQCEIRRYSRDKLQTIGVLGKGVYGEVFLAKAPPVTDEGEDQLVYVKSLTSKDEQVQIDFRQEVEMFHKLNHDRICKLLARCKEMEPIYLVMEYCEWGDLKQFLLATSRDNGQQLTISPPDQSQKIHMCKQVAEAMEYIANNRFVHKDIASRNILLEPNLSVKVANLALSRDIYASEYVSSRSGLLLPLRWTSPEAWLEDDYSTKSDVWSYGCLLYEVFNGGDIPYPDMTNEAVISGYEKDDIAPPTCENMPSDIEAIALKCWSSSPKNRPDFSQISAMISQLNADSDV